MHKEIKSYLESFDCQKTPLHSDQDEHLISDNIKRLLKELGTYNPDDGDLFEQIAFDFMPDYPDKLNGWRTYYGPMLVMPNKAGQMIEYPSIQKVTRETLAYWNKRALETSNPILVSRYSDLVVDFSKKINKTNANYKLIRTVIDSNIAICKDQMMSDLSRKSKIKRALQLVLNIKDKTRLENVINTTIKLEDKIAEDDKPGLWGFTFKWLLLDYKSKIPIKDKTKKYLVDILEKRLNRVLDNPWSTENAVSLLAEYYANENDTVNLMRVLSTLENAVLNNERTKSEPLIKINAFEQMHEIYRKYSDKGFTDSTTASRRILKEISNLNIDWDKSLKPISVKQKIEKSKIDRFVKEIFSNNKLEIILAKIVANFLPIRKNMEIKFKDVVNKYPIQYLFTTQVIAGDGMPIAKLSSLENDYDSHFQRYVSQYMQFGSFMLSISIDELKKRISEEDITKFITNSFLFINEDKEYIKRAFSAFWDNDYIIASHLFIPLIESSIRELVKVNGGIILIPNGINGYDKLPLTSLLKNQYEIINSVFSDLNHDMSFYLRLVLTEKLGMNLRNNFAHGLEKRTLFYREASDRLFHILVSLSLVIKSM